MFGWYRAHIQLTAWGVYDATWLHDYKWELRNVDELRQFVADCAPARAVVARGGIIDSDEVSRSVAFLFKNLKWMQASPQDCVRFAPFVRACGLTGALGSPLERSIYMDMLNDFRKQTLPIGEVLGSFFIEAQLPAYEALVAALERGATPEYLRALSTGKWMGWVTVAALCERAAYTESVGVPPDYLRDVFVSLSDDALWVDAMDVERCYRDGVPSAYLAQCMEAQITALAARAGWRDGVPLEYLTIL
jgi:hypothetical protein